MKHLLLGFVFTTFLVGFNLQGYATDSHDRNEFCGRVEIGQGSGYSDIRAVNGGQQLIPLNGRTDKILRNAADTDQEVCVFGYALSSAAYQKKSGQLPTWFVYFK